MNTANEGLSGLKNFIKLFTYDRTSKSDSLNVSGESGNKKIFGINLMANGSTVVSVFFSSTLGRSCFFSIGFPLRRGANIKNFFF